MSAPEPYGMTTPCAHCPFRTDVPPFIKAVRVRQIQRSLERGEFPCHKTTEPDDAEGSPQSSADEIHCAGALILMEKSRCVGQMQLMAKRCGMYDPTQLNLDAPVYATFDEMYEAHKAAENS